MNNEFTKDDAISSSLGLKKIKIEDLKKDLGLPESAEFCGYLVHIVEADEFLAHYIDSPEKTERAFVKSPEIALRFETFSEAFKIARPYKKEVVVGLFDLGSQLYVFEVQ